MPEPELFGIGISIWASIGVAVGTILLAFFTYKSVKVSEKQIELSRKMVEKPRILEKINKTLNSLKTELESELIDIENTNIKWSRKSDQNNLYLSSLMFPLSRKKQFYLGIQYLFVGPEKGENKKYSKVIRSIDTNIRERYRLYVSIDAELSILERKILNDNFYDRILNFFTNLPEYTLKKDDKGDIFLTYFDGSGTIKILKPDLFNIIESMMISLMLDPLRPDHEMSGVLGYQKMIRDLYPYVAKTIIDHPIQEGVSNINFISLDLVELKSLDKEILSDITLLKQFYREDYILTDKELDSLYGIEDTPIY
jgi:hypothetical protein